MGVLTAQKRTVVRYDQPKGVVKINPFFGLLIKLIELTIPKMAVEWVKHHFRHAPREPGRKLADIDNDPPPLSPRRPRPKPRPASALTRPIITGIILLLICGVTLAAIRGLIEPSAQQAPKPPMAPGDQPGKSDYSGDHDFKALQHEFPHEYWSGHVGIDTTTGEIFVGPQDIDVANASSITCVPCMKRPYGYGVRLHFRIISDATGGFQVALPGSLSVQIGDGTLGDFTVKVGDHYLDSLGRSRDIQKKTGQICRSRCTLEEEMIVTIEYSGRRLIISGGLDGSKKIIDIPLDAKLLGQSNQSSRHLSLRTYGSEVRFSKVTVYSLDDVGKGNSQ